MLSDVQLRQIMPNLAATKLALYLPALNRAMQTYGVDTMLRTAAFIAQLAHESGEFRWMEEIWGPTDAQRRYEPPSDLAAKLGNTQAGDGKLFKGRGPIQITGRFNYKKYGGLLAIDLIANPALAATPDVAFAPPGCTGRRMALTSWPMPSSSSRSRGASTAARMAWRTGRSTTRPPGMCSRKASLPAR
jgi:putative chitinase